MQSRLDRATWTLLAVLVASAAALLVQRAACSPAGTLIRQDASAPWILPATRVTAQVRQWGREKAPSSLYSRSFALEEPRLPVTLAVRAFGDFTVRLNGESLVASPPASAALPRSWRRFITLEVGGALRPGSNRIEVEVRNLRGPPLLSARLEGEGLSVATGPDWRASTETGEGGVFVANDLRRHPQAGVGEVPLVALGESAPILALIFALGALASRIPASRLRGSGRADPARWALGALTLGWLALFVLRFSGIDLATGFDAGNHRLYLDLLRSEGRVPLAEDGWSTFHPPLFYLLAAGLEAVGGTLGAKLVPFAAGLASPFLAAALARRLLPEAPTARLHAVLFAGLLPMNLYMAAYFSNEGLHALLAGCALLVAVDLLRADELRPGRVALLSVLLGAALLTKFTALVIAGLAGAAVAARLALAERERPARLLAGLAALLLPALAIAGWFYARNVLEYGRPVVGNWALAGPGQAWWSAPGFHTPAYYWSFGESLLRPFFAAFTSFGDALYSTLFGDGLLGGRATLSARHPHWNYTMMAAGYLLALPAVALLAAGSLRLLARMLRDPDPRERAALGLGLGFAGALGFAILYTTLALPYFSQARASYGLAAVPVLAVAFAAGFDALDGWLMRRELAPLRALLYGWCTAMFGAFYLSFAG